MSLQFTIHFPILQPCPTPINRPTLPKPPGKLSAQDKKITAYVAEVDLFLTTLVNDPALKAIAETHGYDADELAIGTGLVTALGGGVEGRQQAIGDKKKQQDELILAEKTAREDYAAFREIARASFPDPSDRATLGLTGDVPEDMDRFITAAKTSYINIGKPPYIVKATKRNYAPARLATLLDALGKLTDEESDRDTESGDAAEDTKTRNTAYTALRKWTKECKGVIRGALRGKHSQLTKLKL